MSQEDVVDTIDAPEIEAECEVVEAVNIEVQLEEGVNVSLTNEDEVDDPDYLPMEQSDTDDDLEDNELSDDEEYIEARQNRVKFRNYVAVDEVCDNVVTSKGLQGVRSKANTSTSVEDVNDEMEFHSEYEDSDGDINSICSSEESGMDDCDRKRKKKVIYDPKCDHKSMEFILGMRFEHGHQCKDAVQKWAILNGKNVLFTRCSKKQIEVHCHEGCKWKLYGSFISAEKKFAIKTYVPEHTCSRYMKNRQATTGWIAKEYLHRFRRNPNWSVKDLEDDLVKKWCVKVSKWKCYRAK